MTDLLTVTLAAAAVLIPLDLVRSPFSLDRARAHDRALLRLLVIATLALLTVDLVPGLVLGLGVLGYCRERSLRHLLTTAGLAAVWLTAPLLAPLSWAIALGWLLLAPLEVAGSTFCWGAATGRWPGATLAARLPLGPLGLFLGFRAQHTAFASGLALLVPFAWALYPALGVLWCVMLLGISCWTAIIAGLVGLAIVRPDLAWLCGLVFGLGLALVIPKTLRPVTDPYVYVPTWLDRFTPRGGSLDSWNERFRSWRFLLSAMRRWSWRTWLHGRGWNGTNQDLLRAQALRQVIATQGTAHNDVLDVVYSSGALGLLLLGVLACRLGPALTLGDPWSAVVVVGLVIALAQHALRYPSVGLVWWLACALVAHGGR